MVVSRLIGRKVGEPATNVTHGQVVKTPPSQDDTKYSLLYMVRPGARVADLWAGHFPYSGGARASLLGEGAGSRRPSIRRSGAGSR
jgi:hypothetical protein